MVSRNSSSKRVVVKKEPKASRGKRLLSRDPTVAQKGKQRTTTKPLKRTSIDLETKVAMIRAMEQENIKQTQVAQRFGVGKATLCMILKNRESIMEFYQDSPTRMRMRKAARPDMDEAVFQWYKDLTDRGEHVNGPRLIVKAGQIGQELGYGKIKISDGWLERFKFRHNISFKSPKNGIESNRSVNRESSSRRTIVPRSKSGNRNVGLKNKVQVDTKTKRRLDQKARQNVQHKSKRSKKPNIREQTASPDDDDVIDVSFVYDPSDETIHDEAEMMHQDEEEVDVSLKYSPSDTFHAQEMCLFYHLKPEDAHEVQGGRFSEGERSEQRLTVLFCCNASGTEKLPPLVVGSHPKPRRLTSVSYESNCHSWMTPGIFRKWLQDLDGRMDRRVALVVDDTPVHAVSMPLEKVHVFWAPPNHMHSQATSVIANLMKMHYRMNFLTTDEHKQFNPFIIKDALNMLSAAWEQVTADDISICFDNDPSANSLVSKLAQTLNNRIKITLPPDMTLLDYATSENEAWVAADLAGGVEIVPEVLHPPGAAYVSQDERSRTDDDAVTVIPVLKKFVYTQDDPPNDVLKALSVLENYVHRKTLR